MSNIWFSSDLHFGHDREFVWAVRGFKSVNEMNSAIVSNWDSIVQPEDTVYLLGDIMLGDNEIGMNWLKQLTGNIKIILGNHDTNKRIAFYKENGYEILGYGMPLKISNQRFFLSHYPTMTSNLEKSSNLKEHVINLYGHTHQKTNFYNGMPFMYHVGVDSHNCTPINLETIIEDIKKEAEKCITYIKDE